MHVPKFGLFLMFKCKKYNTMPNYFFQAVDELVAVSGTMPIMAGFKLFWNTFPTMTGWEIVRRSYNTMIKFAETTMRSHAKSFDATGNS